MSKKLTSNEIAWGKKAIAFVTRSHRHLWGKNNEDPLSYLFTRGLKNQFVKDTLIGWNKFGQKRPLKNWGLELDSQSDKKLFLASGIVIPFIVKKQLKSVFIHTFNENQINTTTIVPGSLIPTMMLGSSLEKTQKKIVFINDIIDGLFLFQEAKGDCCVMIHPDPDMALANHFKSIIKQAERAIIFSSKKKETVINKTLFPDLADQRFFTYQLKEELKESYLND
ncbi:MAG: hypothetical protein GY699_04725 [Desulfobacteraceae bacterium]|nr:hypothetical protein [Desulfobacteraceae bacterium]